MSIFLILWLSGLVVLIALRFGKRFNAEFRRQEMVTWPTAKGIFDTENLQLRNDPDRKGAVGELDRDYQFYSHGKAYTGRKLIAEEITISREQQLIVNKLLNKGRDDLSVRFNPKQPEDNVLRVGHAHLTWWKIFVYAFFGVVIPVFMVYCILQWPNTAETWFDTLHF